MNRLNDSRGFGLAEFLIVLGIGGLIVYGLTETLTYISRGNVQVRRDLDVEMIGNQIRSVMVDSVACRKTLSGIDMKVAGSSFSQVIDAEDRVRYEVTQSFPPNGIRLETMTVESFTPDHPIHAPSKGFASLRLAFTMGDQMSDRTFEKSVRVYAELSEDSTTLNHVLDCRAFSPDEKVWRRAENDNIFYDSGFVGFGTSEPDSPVTVVDRRKETDIGGVIVTGTNKTVDLYSYDQAPYFNDAGYEMHRSRGNLDSPKAVKRDDQLGTMRFLGWDGSGIKWGSRINAVANTDASANNAPTRLDFMVTNRRQRVKGHGKRDGGGEGPIALRITEKGNVAIGWFYHDGSGDENYFYTPNDRLYVAGNGIAKKDGGSPYWSVFSDPRLKNFHGEFEHGLREIAALYAIRYKYNADTKYGLNSKDETIGFFAQDIQKVIPEGVHENEDGFLKVNVDPLYFAMVNAIRELKEMGDRALAFLGDRSQRVEKARAELDAINAEIQALEAESQQIDLKLDQVEKSCKK